MKSFILTLILCFLISGCASLHMRSNDTTGTKIAKGVARVPVAILLLGFSEAWHYNERTMESWLGNDVRDLIMAWGQPQAVLDDGSGGNILIYSATRTYVTPGSSTTTTSGNAYGQVYGDSIYVHGQSQSQTTYTPAQVNQWQVYKRFRVNSEGKIVQYAWKGL